MIYHTAISDKEIHKKIKHHEIGFGGNAKLKIFGTLQCPSGKRMNKQNRIFFVSQKEAMEEGCRPCGNCMKAQYNLWKK